MKRRILVVDDQKAITDLLVTYLLQNGYDPIVACDGEDALKKFNEYHLDMVLLDIMMPKKDGYEVLKEIRKSSMTPVIMITAKGEEGDLIMGLDYGADDYIVKPFSPKEVLARMNAVLRRIVKEDSTDKKNRLNIHNLEVYLDQFKVLIDGQEINLTKKEIEILWVLASHPGKVFSRDELLDLVWGYDYYGDIRTVDTHMKRLRAKLGSNVYWSIKTIWGVGYQFEKTE